MTVRSAGWALLVSLTIAVAATVTTVGIEATVGTEAQTLATVRGRVVDAKGAPVVRVKVTIAEQWSYSDNAGRFVVTRVPPGTHHVFLERGRRKVDAATVSVRPPITEAPDLRW